MDHSYLRDEEYKKNFQKFLESEEKRNPKVVWTLRILSPLILFSILYSFYTGSMDHLFYHKDKSIIVVLLLFIIIPLTAGILFYAWMNGSIFSVWAGLIALLIHGPYAAYWTGKHEKDTYLTSGAIIKAVVTETFRENRGEMYRRMYYKFEVNNKTYGSFRSKNLGKHHVGDSIDVIYDKNNPVMNEPLELFKEEMKE